MDGVYDLDLGSDPEQAECDTTETCTVDASPCNGNGYRVDRDGECYDTLCKAPWVELYVR